MLRLYPPAGPADSAGLATPLGLADAYAYPERAAGPYLRANMVASLDGAAHVAGRSAALSSEADKRIFGVLRALADAVVVGAETVRAEGYRPAKSRAAFAERRAADGRPPAPAVVVLSRGLDLDFGTPLFQEATTPTLLLTGADAPAARFAAAEAAGVRVVVSGDGEGVDPVRAVRELAALGHTRLLHEGGPRVLAQFAAAEVLDELCLTVAPLVVGGGSPRIMDGPAMGSAAATGTAGGGVAVADVTGGARFVPLSVLEEDGFLFTRYVRA
jgi:riboflavin biosynthesis pyrimidine reductase